MIHSAEYKGSFPSVAKCPDSRRPEYAFIGRSNVGKSSLINMLTQRKDLARTSKKPGKTQMINYFLINEDWFLVDLPGYGYAKVSKKQRKSWHEMIEGFLAKRVQLCNIFNLIDPNVEPQERDLAFINWMGQQGLPFSIVFTKMDKKGKSQRLENIEAFKNRLLEDWEELPPMFYTSSQERTGRDEILSYIQAINEEV